MLRRIKKYIEKIPLLGYLSIRIWQRIKQSSMFTILYENLSSISHVYEISIPPYTANSSNNSSEMFYLDFENVFRGDESLISKRQSIYLKHINKYKKLSDGKFFLDIGCGRGEFLKLLSQYKISAKGIETNRVEYENLRTSGFNVELNDANSYLSTIGDNTLSGISVLQVIEHMDFEYLQRFLELTFKKIDREGIIILETVNPKCSLALSNFYIDPTHMRPYPYELIKFLLERHGFKNIRCIFSSPSPKPLRVNNIPESNYMDYALVGWK